jgi:hypothetical protein
VHDSSRPLLPLVCCLAGPVASRCSARRDETGQLLCSLTRTPVHAAAFGGKRGARGPRVRTHDPVRVQITHRRARPHPIRIPNSPAPQPARATEDPDANLVSNPVMSSRPIRARVRPRRAGRIATDPFLPRAATVRFDRLRSPELFATPGFVHRGLGCCEDVGRW